MLLEIAIVVVLICVNGLLAMSELAVVSARPARLKALIEREVRGAAAALELGSNPGRFLSTVQIGITLVGVLSGAFSGATLGERLADALIQSGMSPNLAHPLCVGIVVAVITYGSLIIGELVPKQIALRDPERIAVMVAAGTLMRCQGSGVENATPTPSASRGSITTICNPRHPRRRIWIAARVPDGPPPTIATVAGLPMGTSLERLRQERDRRHHEVDQQRSKDQEQAQRTRDR